MISKVVDIFMRRFIFLAFALLFSTGCSWVTRDYTFAQLNENGWKSEFIEASQPSVKHVPIPDQHLHTFVADGIKIRAWSGYTVVLTAGVWPLPVVPLSMLDQNKLAVSFQIEAIDRRVQIDLDLLEVTDFSGSPMPFSEMIVGSSPGRIFQKAEEAIFVNPGEPLDFTLRSDVDVQEIDSLIIKLKGVKVGDVVLEIPELKLEKKRGSFNYDEFTI